MATGGAIKAGEAFIELTLKGARGFDQKLRMAMRAMGRLAVSAAKVGVALGAAFGTATIAAMTKSLKLFVQIGDQMQKMSLRTGASARALSELGFAAEQSGSSIETIERGLRGMARAIRGLERGLSTQVEAFDALGISLEDIQDLEPDKQLELIASALADIENPTQRAALAMETLGRAGTELLPLFANGAEGIRNLREQADILGRSVSQEQADAAARLADRWNEVKSAFRGVAFEIGANLAPAFENALVAMRNFLLDWKFWLEDLQIEAAKAFGGIGRIISLVDPQRGQSIQQGADILGQAFQFRRSLGSARQRPSARFEELLQTQPQTIAEPIGEAVAEALKETAGVGGAAFGSFAGDARQFGIVSVGRKQLRALERIEAIQQQQNEILRTNGFFAFL